ncbi:MAG: acetate kinase [Pseudoxanthomonas sp.]
MLPGLAPMMCMAMAASTNAKAEEPISVIADDEWPGVSPPDASRQSGATDMTELDVLQIKINEQTRQLDEMRKALDAQEKNLASLQHSLNIELLSDARARGAPPPVLQQSPAHALRDSGTQQQTANSPQAANYAQASARQHDSRESVGQAPELETRPPEVAQIFDQPGVLTPRGKLVLEPSVQYGYSANDRVALVGYTIIPALLIGLIDVRQVKTTTAIATLTGRYGLGKRWELEAKLPYVYANGDTVSREIFTGSAQDRVFNASGNGMGDVELTTRYQLNHGGPDKSFYVGWLRYKSRTGKDLFEVVTDCVTRCIGNTTGTGLPLELPTGSGFEAIQPGITWLFPSDPVVLFGSLSYLHNFKRRNVSRTVIDGQREQLGDISAGDIIGFNIGMGLALNEKAAISIGYDQSIIGKTKQNGDDVAGAVRLTLGTLLVGGTYRFNERASLNLALGVGVTRDTPDITFTVRIPINF